MSWKIESLKVQNFKFFNEVFTLPVNCKNVLLYGENGSGKSSIYWSFYTIFQACLKTNLADAQKYFSYGNSQNLRNRYSNAADYSGIKITFKNGGTGLSFEDSSTIVAVSDPLHADFMKLSMASSDFMNYKFLSSIFDFSNSEENDIFKVLVKEVFPFLNFRDSLLLDDGTDSGRRDADYWWKYLSNPNDHVPRRNDAPNGAFIVTSFQYRSYVEKLNQFNRNLKQELSLIFNDANNKLKNLFGENIALHFKYQDATFNNRIGTSKSHDGKLHCPKIIVSAKMTDDNIIDQSSIAHPRSFFNEARLTCMALALRLAFHDARNIAGEDFAPVIFIDDLLISLDMGCRLSVIPRILKYADSKQMFIFTHDRAFYDLTWGEIQKAGKTKNWVRFELYTNYKNGKVVPVLITKKTALESAKQKLRALDLSGCANTLRSACESELKRILPQNLTLKKQIKEDDPVQFNNLNALIGQLSTFRQKFFDKDLNSFPDIVPNLSNHRKLVMNPYSHDDVETPLYRRELEQAVEDVERLTKVEKKRLIKDEEIGNKVFKISITNGARTIESTFVFTERFERVTYEGVRYYGASMICVRTVTPGTIATNGQRYDVRKLYKDMYEHLELIAATRPKLEDVLVSVSDGKQLSAM